MSENIVIETELIDDQPVPANSKKREITATVVAGVVTCILGLAATGVVNKIGETVKHRIAPPTEKTDE